MNKTAIKFWVLSVFCALSILLILYGGIVGSLDFVVTNGFCFLVMWLGIPTEEKPKWQAR